MFIDLILPARGETVAIDHAYSLYGAISRLMPSVHHEDSPIRVASLTGVAVGVGRLALNEHSVLRLRLPSDDVKSVLPLAGKVLDLDGDRVRLGVPNLQTLIPAASLISRITTFKNAEEPEKFLETARIKLMELGIRGEPQLPIHLDGEYAGQPQRRIVRIKGVAIVGYALIVSELSAEDSLKLQSHGLGGRTHMGCGFFVPFRARES